MSNGAIGMIILAIVYTGLIAVLINSRRELDEKLYEKNEKIAGLQDDLYKYIGQSNRLLELVKDILELNPAENIEKKINEYMKERRGGKP